MLGSVGLLTCHNSSAPHDAELNGQGCVPIKLNVWTLELEFHIISHVTKLSFYFFQP